MNAHRAETRQGCLDGAGAFNLVCAQDLHTSLALSIALPVATCGALFLLLLVIFGCFYKKIFQ